MLFLESNIRVEFNPSAECRAKHFSHSTGILLTKLLNNLATILFMRNYEKNAKQK